MYTRRARNAIEYSASLATRLIRRLINMWCKNYSNTFSSFPLP